MKQIMLIDGNSIGFANHQATRLIYDGQQVQAIFGFIKTIKKLKEKHPNHEMIVLWDGHSWRYDIYSEYKANRKNPKTELMKKYYIMQKPAIFKALQYLGIKQITVANWEADDIAAVLSNKFSQQNAQVLLVSGDKDWLQLINRQVTWYDPIRNRDCNESNLESFTGCQTVQQFIDVKCLAGDVSDNIKGVGGIGETRALDMFKEYSCVNDFLQAKVSDDVKKKWSKYLRDFYDNTKEGHEKYQLNYKLVALNYQNLPAPKEINIEDGQLNFDNFIELCAEYGFASIRLDINNFKLLFGKK